MGDQPAGLPENYPFHAYRPRGWDPEDTNYDPPSEKLPRKLHWRHKRRIYQERIAALRERYRNPPRPQTEYPAYSLTCNHGIESKIVARNEGDSINAGRSLHDQVVLECLVGPDGRQASHELTINHDILSANYRFYDRDDEENPDKNVPGRIAEAEARIVLQSFLNGHFPQGRVDPIIPEEVRAERKDRWILGNTSKYVLMTMHYPEIVIMEKITASGQKPEYKVLRELDGAFDLTLGDEQHLVVMESKLDHFDTKPGPLIDQVFGPLSELRPDTQFTYALFLPKALMFKNEELRILNPRPLSIYHGLRTHGISTLLFTFSKTRDQFREYERHVMNQYKILKGENFTIPGRLVRQGGEERFYNGSPEPFVRWVPIEYGPNIVRRIPNPKYEALTQPVHE